jgi:hypothetical protein
MSNQRRRMMKKLLASYRTAHSHSATDTTFQVMSPPLTFEVTLHCAKNTLQGMAHWERECGRAEVVCGGKSRLGVEVWKRRIETR